MVTPKEPLILNRVHGGSASEFGQFWSHEPREGNLGYRMDAAVLPQWNSMDRSTSLFVPPEVFMYEGKVARQANYLGGGWQVFIPQEVMKHLTEAQLGSEASDGQCQRAIDAIKELQDNIMKSYVKEVDERIGQRALSHGSELHSLPPEVQKILEDDGNPERMIASSDGRISKGTYVIHKDSIPDLGGRRKNILVSVRLEFVRSETRPSTAGSTTATETINYYNRITEIKETS